jgi:hypothetical protein
MSIKKLKNKDVTINTSITEDHRAFIEDQCHKLGISSSEYLRHLLLDQIQIANLPKADELLMGEGWSYVFGFWVTDHVDYVRLVITRGGLWGGSKNYYLLSIGNHWDKAKLIGSYIFIREVIAAAKKEFNKGGYEATLKKEKKYMAVESQYSTLGLPEDIGLTMDQASVLISLQANFKRIMNLCILHNLQ